MTATVLDMKIEEIKAYLDAYVKDDNFKISDNSPLKNLMMSIIPKLKDNQLGEFHSLIAKAQEKANTKEPAMVDFFSKLNRLIPTEKPKITLQLTN